MTERIQITDETLTEVASFLTHYDENMSKERSEYYTNVIQQIYDDNKKIDKITAFAKSLAYSNSHISWQLKQLLQKKPTKTL